MNQLPPKPENVVFGIRADGKVMSPGLPSAAEAEEMARGLFEHGYKRVDVIDRASGRLVKRLDAPST
jgi:hypothetical protein